MSSGAGQATLQSHGELPQAWGMPRRNLTISDFSGDRRQRCCVPSVWELRSPAAAWTCFRQYPSEKLSLQATRMLSPISLTSSKSSHLKSKNRILSFQSFVVNFINSLNSKHVTGASFECVKKRAVLGRLPFFISLTFIFILSIGVFTCMDVCVFCVCSTCAGQKRVSEPMELELQTALSSPVWVLGTEFWSSARAAGVT